MKIELSKSELLFDIHNKSHLDVSDITDAEARYRVEAGTEKTAEVERSLVTSLSMLHQIAGRYLVTDMTYTAGNDIGLPSTIVLDFSFSERRLDGKAQALADAIHAYLVDNTLALFYNSVSDATLATKRAQLALTDSQLVQTLVYTKKPPYQLSR